MEKPVGWCHKSIGHEKERNSRVLEREPGAKRHGNARTGRMYRRAGLFLAASGSLEPFPVFLGVLRDFCLTLWFTILVWLGGHGHVYS